ncbi:MAG: ABC-F family ATP-binding cassette domain-containing protein [Bacilli bacterium]
MYVLQLSNISKYFGSDCLFSGVKMDIGATDRVALVGRNGAGKSTLLKIITGETTYDDGQIHIGKETTVGYLAQSSGLNLEHTVWEAMMETFRSILDLEARIRETEKQLASASGDALEQLLRRYDAMQHEFTQANGYAVESEARSILHGLGFADMHAQTVATLSGGQRTRLALGKLLLSKPDLLILDEPTNHLDLDTLTWLENYLRNYDRALLIVSHDRFFLDEVVTTVYELSHGECRKFTGNYSDYAIARTLLHEQAIKQFEKQQEEIQRIESFIQKNIARASTTKRAQSRRKQLDRMVRMDKPLGDEGSAKLQFHIERPSGNDVLRLESIVVGYAEPLAAPFTHTVQRGARVALIGENGSGKSTLLKTIVGQLAPLKGDYAIGAHVKIGYYSQEHANLTRTKTVLQELWDEYPLMQEREVRTVLGNFLFQGDDVFKVVAELSGGERARLILAKLMLERNNFLVLDEPTNHLDLDSKEVLEASLAEFEGTILFVSHDRYFINSIATNVLALEEANFTVYLGDYDYFMEKKAEAEAILALEAADTPKTVVTQAAPNNYAQSKEQKRLERQRQRKLEEVEERIATLEETIELLQTTMCAPDVVNDFTQLQQLQQQLTEQETSLEEAYAQWEELQS